MLKPIFFASLLLFGSIIYSGCVKDSLNKPIVTNTTPPGIVSNVSVENQNGRAVLTYSLPSDGDLLYVKAVYETSPGVKQEAIASRYTNTMVVDGFGDTLSHQIELYAVNSSEVPSNPVDVTVNPLTPGYVYARRSLNVVATFGGFVVSAKNPVGDNLAIIPMVDTAGDGLWTQTVGLDNIYGNDTSLVATRRGQPAVERKYAFVVRDRWMHYSDTLFQSLTPLFETEIDKSKWSKFVLSHDAPILQSTTDVPNLWKVANIATIAWPNTYFTVEGLTTPQMVTIDLGSAHTFSRIIVYPYKEAQGYYAKNNPKDFEIWASNSPDLSDPVDGSNTPGASWTLLGTFHVVKPSGSPYGTETTTDQAAGFSGWSFDFPEGISSYRYIRFRQLKNWLNNCSISMRQLTLWGQ